jgi:CheY-like chemotaxis protein
MTQGGNEQSFSVLFVDDEEKAQKYFRMAYANDFPVLTAGSVPQALDILAQHGEGIGVLVTDQRMPGQQGIDLLKQAREYWPAIVRILTTAYSDLDDAIAAVNRGEIFRYVTKPWDIKALRAELRQAMDYFFLRRERDLLLNEKLSVRRRMVQSERLVGLLAITAGLEHLRHAPFAIAAWARDALAGESCAQPADADLELWGQQVLETLSLMQTHRALRSLDKSVESGFPDRTDLGGLLRDAGLPVEGDVGTVFMRRKLIDRAVGILKYLVGNPATDRSERCVVATRIGALTVTVTGPGATSNTSATDPATDGPEGRLLDAYLIAWHHGGALKATTSQGQSQFVLTLPKEPDTVVLPKLDEEALAGFFSMFED